MIDSPLAPAPILDTQTSGLLAVIALTVTAALTISNCSGDPPDSEPVETVVTQPATAQPLPSARDAPAGLTVAVAVAPASGSHVLAPSDEIDGLAPIEFAQDYQQRQTELWHQATRYRP